MGTITPFLKSFNGGELTPRLGGRLDLDKFHDGCRILENAICTVQGPATRRGAFRMVREAKDSTKLTRVIPFEVGTSTAYIIEVGEGYLRFYRSGTMVAEGGVELVTNGTFAADLASWTDLDSHPGVSSWSANYGGSMELNNDTAHREQSIATTAGGAYALTFTVMSGSVKMQVGSGSGLQDVVGRTKYDVSATPYTVSFTATSAISYIGLLVTKPGPTYVDDVSCIGSVTPVEVTTPYNEADLFAIQYAQSADLLYLTHSTYAQRKLSRLLENGTSWGFKQVKFMPPPSIEDFTDYSGGTIKVALSAITGTGVKVVSSAAVFLAADVSRRMKYLDAGADFTAYVNASEMTAEIIDDFPAALVDTTPVSTLSSTTVTVTTSSAHGISAGQATSGIWVRLTSGAQAGEMRQVASVTNSVVFVLVAAFSVNQVGVNWSKHYAIASGSWEIGGSPVATLTPSAVGPVGSTITLGLAANGWRQKDVDLGKYVKVNSGIANLTLFGSATSVSAQVVKVLSGTSASAGGDWSVEEPSWNATHGYPAAVCFFEQRLMFGGTLRQPTTIWGSASGDYENFAAGVDAGDSSEYPLTAFKVNTVRWLSPAKSLMGGTVAAEFSLTGSSDAALTPTNGRPLPETMHGSAAIMPVRIGHLVLFVQTQGRKVREISYKLDDDAFVAPDLTRLAEHITLGGIVDMAYQQEPESILWCVRADGVLLGCTYNREEKVFGWHRHVTDGFFESVAVIPDPVNNRDQLWVVVQRTIGGATKRYIEYLDPDIVVGDSFVRYSGSAATVITGLDHLEGEGVDVVADGFVVTGHTVSGGQITLARAASDVVVGLHYETTVEPEPPEYINDKGQNNVYSQKQWAEVVLRFYETGLSGVTVNGMTLPARSGSDPLDTATAPFTGDAQTPLLGTTRAGVLTIKQTLPLPFTLLAVAGTLEMGD